MKPLLFALAFAATAVQAGTPTTNLAASLFDRGESFAEFLTHVTAQRELWLRNAARTGIARDAVSRLTRARSGLQLLIVAEDWCPDSVYTVPYVANLSSAAGIEVRMVDRSAGDALMARHPARDGRKVTPTIVLLRDRRDVGAWVERPAILIPATGTRISCPPSVTSMISSLSSTGNEATSAPLRSLTAIAATPFPPRPATRYSYDELRLP